MRAEIIYYILKNRSCSISGLILVTKFGNSELKTSTRDNFRFCKRFHRNHVTLCFSNRFILFGVRTLIRIRATISVFGRSVSGFKHVDFGHLLDGIMVSPCMTADDSTVFPAQNLNSCGLRRNLFQRKICENLRLIALVRRR